MQVNSSGCIGVSGDRRVVTYLCLPQLSAQSEEGVLKRRVSSRVVGLCC